MKLPRQVVSVLLCLAYVRSREGVCGTLEFLLFRQPGGSGSVISSLPYERGYQHGHLMAREIPEYLERCAAELGTKEQWDQYRTTANALFLRGFDREIMEEMRGIAEGASDAGAKWLKRRIDLMDIVVANVTVELGELSEAVSTTASGLEGLSFDKPAYAAGKRDSVLDQCYRRSRQITFGVCGPQCESSLRS